MTCAKAENITKHANAFLHVYIIYNIHFKSQIIDYMHVDVCILVIQIRCHWLANWLPMLKAEYLRGAAFKSITKTQMQRVKTPKHSPNMYARTPAVMCTYKYMLIQARVMLSRQRAAPTI